MPFRTFQWVGDRLHLGTAEPEVELRQLDAREFVLLKSFCYRFEDRDDPENGTVYVIPGADDPDRDPNKKERQTTEVPPNTVIVPPTLHGGKTDLASVPWFMWWLVASYGNHTRAALLHDALYGDEGEVPPMPKREADRLFLVALREPEPEQGKPGVFRHWLMWVAVSLFGNMGPLRGLVCGLHALAVWVLTLAAVEREWGQSLWDLTSRAWWLRLLVAALIVAACLAVLLTALGTSWRAGVDLTGGWLVPALALTIGILVLLLIVEAWLLVAALVLMVLGTLWGLYVARPLRWWLWPTCMIGLPISLLPVGLIFVAVFFVWCIDVGAMVAASARRTRPFELPRMRPYRLPL